jgi:catechol 2,3-dioxygenase-like lactoylglutathione lyase family enzyme
MDWTLEVVVVPVSDVDASIGFYRDRLGFHLDHDTRTEHGRVTQLTPTGSGCSIVIGTFPPMQRMPPGSLHGLQLVVPDARAAREQLVDAGVECEEITVLDERDGGTLFGFADPDGNSWVVQQIRARAQRPLIPRERDHPEG